MEAKEIFQVLLEIRNLKNRKPSDCGVVCMALIIAEKFDGSIKDIAGEAYKSAERAAIHAIATNAGIKPDEKKQINAHIDKHGLETDDDDMRLALESFDRIVGREECAHTSFFNVYYDTQDIPRIDQDVFKHYNYRSGLYAVWERNCFKIQGNNEEEFTPDVLHAIVRNANYEEFKEERLHRNAQGGARHWVYFSRYHNILLDPIPNRWLRFYQFFPVLKQKQRKDRNDPHMVSIGFSK